MNTQTRHGVPPITRLAAGWITFLPATGLAQDQPQAGAPTIRGQLGWPAAPFSEPIVTDRPDFTESTDAVPAGRIQIEMGYTFTYDREDRDRTREHTAPELLTRIGLFEDFELRLGWDGYSWTQSQFRTETRAGRPVTREEWDQGGHDVSLAVKYKFFDQDGIRPHFGVIAGFTAPSGSGLVSSGDVDPEVVLLWAYDLTDRLGLAGNLGIAGPTEDGNRFAQGFGSISLAAGLSERLGTYIEYFGIYPNADQADCAHSVDGGFTFLINDNLQIDWRIGAGLNEEADDFFTGVGFAWRF